MKKIIYYLHTISVLFLAGSMIFSGEADRRVLILCLLIYLILQIAVEITDSWKTASILLCISLAALLPVYRELILFMVPFHISRFTLFFQGKRFCFSLTLFPVPLFFVSDIPLCLFITALLFTLTIYISYYQKKITSLKKSLLKAENDNFRLNKKLIMSREFDEEKEYLLKLEERSKIAQKLHDEIGHTISGSIFQLEAVKLILKEDGERAESMIDNVSTVLNQGIDSIRRSLKVLKPKHHDLGIQTIKKILSEFEAQTGIHMELTSRGDLTSVPNRIWLIINASLKETLTNILKYSKASKAEVSLEILNQLIKFRIHDNGQGAENIHPGMGLAGIDERVCEVNGTLIIDGTRGFSVTMLFKKEEI